MGHHCCVCEQNEAYLYAQNNTRKDIVKISRLLNPTKSSWHIFEQSELPFSAVGVTQFESLLKKNVSLHLVPET